MIARMNTTLKLSPAQREQIVEVMDDTRARMAQMRRAVQRQRRQVMIDTYLKVRAILNPDQQKKFDEEFVPPKFRDEARDAERQDHSVGSGPAPTLIPTP